nr:hypothetical protein HmN_000771200 [Hymenolepis microstoma]
MFCKVNCQENEAYHLTPGEIIISSFTIASKGEEGGDSSPPPHFHSCDYRHEASRGRSLICADGGDSAAPISTSLCQING